MTNQESLNDMGQLASRSASAESSKGCEDTEKRPKTGGTGTPMLSDQQEEVSSPIDSEAPIPAQRPQSSTRQHPLQTLADPKERLRYAKEVFFIIFLDPSSQWLKKNMEFLVSHIYGSHSKTLLHLKINSTNVAFPHGGNERNASDSKLAEIRNYIQRRWPGDPAGEAIFTERYPPQPLVLIHALDEVS